MDTKTRKASKAYIVRLLDIYCYTMDRTSAISESLVLPIIENQRLSSTPPRNSVIRTWCTDAEYPWNVDHYEMLLVRAPNLDFEDILAECWLFRCFVSWIRPDTHCLVGLIENCSKIVVIDICDASFKLLKLSF